MKWAGEIIAMRKVRMIVGIAALTCVLTIPVSETNAQSFVGIYGSVRSQQFMLAHTHYKRIRFLEKMASMLSRGITLPHQVVLTIEECGKQNAFYNQQRRAIVLCHELIAYIAQGIQRDFARVASSDEIANAVGGGIVFVLMHELGHALIHVLDLPVLGREEDAADQIGAFFLLHSDNAPYALAGALWFFRQKILIYTRRHFSDEHSLDPQRQSNLACWAFGKEPHRYQYLLQGGYLTRERAVRCAVEYRRLDSSIRKLLGNNVRLPP